MSPDTTQSATLQLPPLGAHIPSMQEHLNIQALRIQSQGKLHHAKSVATLGNEALRNFFGIYTSHPSLNLNLGDLKSTQKGKILKKNGFIYYGEAQSSLMEGRGILLQPEGKVYEGWFCNGEKSGKGYQVYPGGNLYIGDFERNQKHGQGIYFWFQTSMSIVEGSCNTELYKGQWWGGMPSGLGMHHRITGDIYQGQFKNGLKHGNGVQKFANKDLYKGGYINGLPDGYGQYEWKDGSVYKGDFKQGLRHGFGVWKQRKATHGEHYKGHYLFDKKSGYGVYVWGNKQQYKGQFFQDKRHGFGELFEGDKLCYSGTWEHGQQNPSPKYQRRKARSQINRKQVERIVTEGNVTSPTKSVINSTPSPRFHSRKVFMQDTTQPNLKQVTHKRVHDLESQFNPEVAKIERSRFGRAGHRNCIPIDQYLTIRKGTTRK